MLKRLFLAVCLLLPAGAFAAEVNLFEAHLAAAYGAKISVEGAGVARQATAFSGDSGQAVRLIGPPDEYLKAEAQVDMRPSNVAKGKAFLKEVARAMIAAAEWPAADRFIEQKAATLSVGEKARLTAGGWVFELDRSSNTMLRLVAARG
ncbi:MAG: hypothetical protein AB7D00_06380 [Rhodospirillaceae bacterium]